MKMDFSKAKKELGRFARIPSLITRHFWISLAAALFLSLAITAFLFYQYVIFLPEERSINHQDRFQVNEKAYEEVMELRKSKSFKEDNFLELFGPFEEESVD
jgi:flagellar biosynthesis/type III secretory pathway M-ring protein FliF/YscJ